MAPTGTTPRAVSLRTAALTAGALLAFAGNSLLCRAALAGGHARPGAFTAVRLVAGASALTALFHLRTSSTGARRRAPDPRQGSWRAAAALVVYAYAFSVAYSRMGAGLGALVLFAAVQLTMLTLGALQGERPRLREGLGITLALAGLAVLVKPGTHGAPLQGVVLMAVAGAAWGLYTMAGRGVGDPIAATADNFARTVPAAALLVVLAWLQEGRAALDATGAVLAAASGALTSGLGYVLWYAALGGLTAPRAAALQLSVPILAALGGGWLLGERWSLRLMLAAGLVLSGVGLAVLRRRR